MTLVLSPVSTSSHQLLQDSWVWDNVDKSPEVLLSSSLRAAYFHTDPVQESTGAAAVRGNKGFRDGVHYWEIDFLEPAVGTSVMVGIGTKKAVLHTKDYKFVNLIGLDNESWGLSYKGTVWHNGQTRKYCEPFYEQSTVIGVHLDMFAGKLSFFKNGVNLGVAFEGLNKLNECLYPIISSTATNTELEVGVQCCRHLSLQEKCLLAVVRSLQDKTDAQVLPLPPIIKQEITLLKC